MRFSAWFVLLWLGFGFVSGFADEGAQAVQGELAQAVASVVQKADISGVSAGFMFARERDGRVWVARGADKSLIPASTAKVLTTAYALDVLGPSYTWQTSLKIRGDLAPERVEGDLVLVLTGDPTLRAQQLWELLRHVRTLGITHITGSLRVDATALGPSEAIVGWTRAKDLSEGTPYYTTIGASAIEFGAVSLDVRPGAQEGEPAIVTAALDGSPWLQIQNQVLTSAAGRKSQIDVEREVKPSGMTLKLSGSIAFDADPTSVRRSVPDPDAYLLAVVRNLCRDLGLKIDKGVVAGAAEASDRVLFSSSSPPLSSVIMDMNKYSSNFMAETVLRTAAREQTGDGGAAHAADALAGWMAAHKLNNPGDVVVNGSGLSRNMRVSPATLVAVLLQGAANPVLSPELHASLAIAGTDGTLRRRLKAYTGLLRAKTGTLDGVFALSGYVQPTRGEPLVFAVLVNVALGTKFDAVAWIDALVTAVVDEVDRQAK